MVKHRTLFLGSPLQIAIPKASTQRVMHRAMQFLRVLTSLRLWPWGDVIAQTVGFLWRRRRIIESIRHDVRLQN